MPVFTRPEGGPVSIVAATIARARPNFDWEIYEHAGHEGSALFKPGQLVMEPIDVVGPALQAEVASFTSLSGLSDRRLWFDAMKAQNAEAPRPRESGPGVNAIVLVGGVRMRVMETVAEAQEVINAARAVA